MMVHRQATRNCPRSNLGRCIRRKGRIRFLLGLTLFYHSLILFAAAIFGFWDDGEFRADGEFATDARVAAVRVEKRMQGDVEKKRFWLSISFTDHQGIEQQAELEIFERLSKALVVGQSLPKVEYLRSKPSKVRVQGINDWKWSLMASIATACLIGAAGLFFSYRLLPETGAHGGGSE
jgi:hypothetical protein